MATVALRGLTRRYPGAERPALAGLDLDIADGELLVVVGPSGCGKSTALRLVAGLDVPDGGQVLIDGKDVVHTPPQDRDVAMVFQGYALYPHLTAREIMAFPLKMRGMPRAEQKKVVDEAATMLGIGHLLARRPGELSGGERQRVAMGRAIVRKPKAFLFDEPLSNLDAALRAELRVDLGALVRRLGTTSLYVTHDQVEAMTLGDRVAVMKDGVLQQVGPPRQIYEDPTNVFVAGFLGSPRINLVEVTRDGDRLRAAGVDVAAPPGMDVPAKAIVGLRPENLAIHPADAAPTPLPASTSLLAARVTAAEPLGAETILHLDAGGTPLVARAPGFARWSAGDAVQVAAVVSTALWFEAGSGERVRA
ncbi:MAG: ABC transporter ATP-binding protein [Polyangiaceae bacterium]